MTVKDLMDYIKENLADGTLHKESKVNISNGEEAIEACSLYNDCCELTINAN